MHKKTKDKEHNYVIVAFLMSLFQSCAQCTQCFKKSSSHMVPLKWYCFTG